ncbi:Ig-like domain repeat protein [Methanosphaera stadtmanae]|uniref:Uncharacterized protein n=1 Tax=Methanosphaera stadtmanae TaxID=2317 RepID=A0A328Q8N8_9EURY|nr:Ig-like domain repeat protein [Methanosphaera stadtmanae]RAP03189.1 hypothetical protein CA615_03570 [Methanosphaera stadtmanae]
MRNKNILLYLFLLLMLFVSISAISATDVDNTTSDTNIIRQKTVETTTDSATSNLIDNTDTKIDDNSNLIANTMNNKEITNNEKNITKKTGNIYKQSPDSQPVSITSSNTSLVSGIYSVYPNNVTITCNNTNAVGDVDLYVDNVLVETYANQNWNNLDIPIPDIKIVNQLPVIPDYVNHAGNYTWRLEFKDNGGYAADSDITGTLEMMEHVEITLVDNITSVYPYEYTSVTYSTRPDNILGAIMITDDGYMLGGNAISTPNIISFQVTLEPGEYSLNAFYRAEIVTDSYYVERGINPSFRYNTYPYSDNCNYVTLTVLKVPVFLRSFNTSFDENNDLYFTMNLSSYDNMFDEYYDGILNVYYDDTLIKSLNLFDEFNDENLENPSVINFTLDKQYNNKNLRFEYTDPYGYYDDMVFERLIDLEEKEVQLTTTSNTIRANVGDLVEIPYSFNDTVNDGKISISYGGSEDNITHVTSSNGIIEFDTTDYLHDEYDLILAYYDSNVFEETSIPITLELYQPTTITSDKSELNIVLGKGNEYTVNFETSLDNWDEVIWGSIDVYIDDNIIDTIIIDDTTGNMGSITFDDYVLENLAPGTHTLRAEFTTDDPYISTSTATVTLNVTGEITIEVPENVTLMIGEDTYIHPIVKFNGKTITDGTLRFEAPNSSSTNIPLGYVYSGGFHILAATDQGIYNITFNYHDNNGVYPDANLTSNLIIRTNTNIEIGTIYNKSYDTYVSICIRNDRGVSIDRTVNITLPTGRLENYQLNKITTIKLDPLPAGEYTIIVEADKDLLHENATERLVFNITQSESNIVPGTTYNYVEMVRSTTKVTKNNTSISATCDIVEVINLANNEVIGTATVNENGFAHSPLNISVAGDYQLRFDFKGNEYLEPSSKYRNITVLKRTTTTGVNVISSTYNDTEITVMVRDNQLKETVLNAPITITLPDGTTINTDTGSTGTVTVPINLAAGTHNITVEYTGSDLLNVSNTTTEIT